MCSYGITEVPLTGPPSQTTPLCVCACVCVGHYPETMHARFNCLQALDPPSPRKLWLWLVDLLNSQSSLLGFGPWSGRRTPKSIHESEFLLGEGALANVTWSKEAACRSRTLVP